MVSLTLDNTGLLKVDNTEGMEYVRAYLDLHENGMLQARLKVKKPCVYANRLYEKKDICPQKVDEMVGSHNLSLDMAHLDNARTTPEFARHYTQVIQESLNHSGSGLVIEPMKSFENGYAFIGDAFIHFVSSMVAYHLYPNETTSKLTMFANSLRSNRYLGASSITYGWAKFIAHHKKKGNDMKSLAGTYRGLIGAIYKSNTMSSLTDILSLVNESLYPEHMLPFESTRPTTGMSILTYTLVGIFGFILGWLVCLSMLSTEQRILHAGIYDYHFL